MQPYQNYYSNPMFGMNYQPQIPQQPQPQFIAGKNVNDFNEVTANDVPMDGRNAVFVKNDLSEIQIRAWSGDGKISTKRYVAISGDFNADTTNVSTEGIKSRNSQADALTAAYDEKLTEIIDRIKKIEKQTAKPARAKKESTDE